MITGIQAAEVAAIEALHRAYYDAWERDDLDSMCAVWLDSDDISLVLPGAEPRRGRHGVLADVVESARLTRGVQFLFSDLEVTVRGDVAMLSAVETCLTPDFAYDAADGFDPLKLAVGSIFVRTATGWRMLRHHVSPIITHLDLGEAG